MFRIEKEFAFSAAHQLHGLRAEHPCGRVHGHNYRVVVALESPTLDSTSFVVDYGELSDLKAYIDTVLDHRNLNDVLLFQTTAENIAKHIFEFTHTCASVVAVKSKRVTLWPLSLTISDVVLVVVP